MDRTGDEIGVTLRTWRVGAAALGGPGRPAVTPPPSPAPPSLHSAVSSGPALGHVLLVRVFTSHVGSAQSFSEECISF